MKLYDFQKKYIDGLPASCLMAADLGTGKTVMSLAHWQRQAFQPNGWTRDEPQPISIGHYTRPLLIVAPAAKIRTGDWEAEVGRWFGDDNYWSQDYPDITYISYESLRLIDKETRRPRWYKYTGARNGGTVYDVICDEAHWLKNPQSKQSRAIYEITRSGGLFIGLTGTPMPNGWKDFAGYSKIFGFTKGITDFQNRYCRIQRHKGYPEIIGYNDIPELERQLDSVVFRLKREDATELPARQMIGRSIKLSEKHLKRYMEYKLTREDKVTGELLDSAPRLLSVLRQSTTDGRLDSLMSVVNDTSDNIIVFFNYTSERKAILKALEKTDKNILHYYGDKHSILPHVIDADKHYGEMKNTILVAHYKSASTGLNLQWANVTIYFSPTYSYQEFEQSIGRTHRNGQTKKCLYYLFNVKSTVDYAIWRCLKEKRDFNEALWAESDEQA